MTTYPLLIDGVAVAGDSAVPVIDKFTGRQFAEVASAGRAHVASAVQAAARAVATHPMPPYERYTVLHRTAELVQKRKHALIETIVAETGSRSLMPRQR